MGPTTFLSCALCAQQFAPEFRYVCPQCGPTGLLDIHYDYAAARSSFDALRRQQAPPGLARYARLLPIQGPESLPPLLVGGTPLTAATALGMPRLFVKEDNRNPTASFKDRASAVAIAVARDLHEPLITGASTGNAASSLAGLCASVGLQTVIFVPATAPEAKVAQLLVYGATVLLVDGTYDDAFELSLEATRRFGWYNRNTGYNPVCLEGKKTVSLEIWEDLGFRAPDAVLVSVGDGCIIGGIGKGFLDLQRMGLIEKLPRLYGVQAEGSSVLAKAFASGHVVPEPQASTCADSICVGEPRVAAQALARVRESEGRFVVVSDAEIQAAQIRLARKTGVFGEPAGAAALAGLPPLLESGELRPDETVVAVVTGHGLKDIRGAMAAVENRPYPIGRDPSGLEAALAGLKLGRKGPTPV